MGEIIFSGSWFSFITTSVLWVVGVIFIFFNLKRVCKNKKQLALGKLLYSAFFLIILIILLVGNFQYTSRDVSAEVKGFDATIETQIIEGKKVERMTSSDVKDNFYSTIDSVKQENSKNEKN